MSVNWDCGKTAAHKHAKEAASISGEFDYKVPTWDVFCDLRVALIWALLIVKFPKDSCWKITEKNWEVVYKRLHILERVNGCYRKYGNGIKKTRDMYFKPEEIKSMIGMAVNAGDMSDAKFKTYIYRQLMDRADVNISISKSHNGKGYGMEEKLMEYALKRKEKN